MQRAQRRQHKQRNAHIAMDHIQRNGPHATNRTQRKLETALGFSKLSESTKAPQNYVQSAISKVQISNRNSSERKLKTSLEINLQQAPSQENLELFDITIPKSQL